MCCCAGVTDFPGFQSDWEPWLGRRVVGKGKLCSFTWDSVSQEFLECSLNFAVCCSQNVLGHCVTALPKEQKCLGSAEKWLFQA